LPDGRPSLLLDLDGTLTDSHDGIVGSIRHALEALGAPAPPDAELGRYIGTPLAHVFAELLGVAREAGAVGRAIAHYRERFGDRGWRENRVYPEVPAFLTAAREGDWRCFVATSKPTLYAERIAVHFGLRPLLEAVHGSELDGRRGEKPELLAHILAHEGLDPKQTVMVGDRRHDVAGARANGVASLGVLWGYGSREELLIAGADALCDRPDGLLTAAASLLPPAASG
jgi:phosphoglycolate phosphatase